MMIDFAYVLAGACVGLIVGLTGVGGGSLMTPLLVLLFGIHPTMAVGTDLLYAAATKSVGTIAHGFRGSVAWRVVALLAVGSVPAASLTLVLLSSIGPWSAASARIMTVALGFALMLTAVLLVSRRWLMRLRARWSSPSPTGEALLTVATGLVIGILVSITSVGAGAVGVTALLLLYPSYSTVRIVGTDIAHAVPLTLVAGVGHWLIGTVDGSILLSLLAGSIPAIAFGSYLAPHVPEQGLRALLATVLGIVGLKLTVFT